VWRFATPHHSNELTLPHYAHCKPSELLKLRSTFARPSSEQV
jgi:hypothetical protein